VSSLRVLIVGEGRHELGIFDGDSGPEGALGALPRLVHRLLGNPDTIEYDCRSLRSIMHVRGKARNRYARKVKGAMRTAKLEGHNGVVVLIDRDREPDGERIGALREGRDSMQADVPVPCAVGTAVETFDAWMIADLTAVQAAKGDHSKVPPNPESLAGKEGTGSHPKEVARAALGPGLARAYSTVAENADFEVLKRQCPQGFAPFAGEVEKHLVPVVQGSR